MQPNYTYQKTKKVKNYLKRIEIAKGVIDLLPQLPHIENNLRRKSLLKSSLFSARIEGNQLKYEDVQFAERGSRTEGAEKIEVFNILDALRWLHSTQSPKTLIPNLILKLHQMVMKDLSPSAGKFRRESSAIFNQAGVAIYFTPPPAKILSLIQKLLNTTNSSHQPTPIKAALFHFSFEKIHPFLDGNGRVGRLASTFILKQGGFGFRGLVSLEEYLDKHRPTYYDLLAISQKDITEFVEFFLETITIQAEKAIAGLNDVKEEQPEDNLLPRRREILEIIRDHQMVPFDFIRRRFLAIPESTLHYDLKKLREGGFVRKIGSTRGALYRPHRTTDV